ncbi:MAG: hypothetical protein HZA35_00820 [Parcubacteria group bacterium]|nr:hypothetical protein [Parcubacteria group bacterium]
MLPLFWFLEGGVGMACDRFVYWNTKKPTKRNLEYILGDYVGTIAEVTWNRDRWMVLLPGKSSFPFKRVIGRDGIFGHEERFFEVWIGKDCIDVITRQADHFTNAIARGFMELVVQYHDARTSE